MLYASKCYIRGCYSQGPLYWNSNDDKLYEDGMKWPYMAIVGNVNPGFRLLAKEGKKMKRQMGIVGKKESYFND